MSRTTPTFADSSIASGEPWRVECRASRAFVAWRFAVCTLAVCGVLASGLAAPLKILAVAAVLGGATLTFSRRWGSPRQWGNPRSGSPRRCGSPRWWGGVRAAAPFVGVLRIDADGSWALPGSHLSGLRVAGAAEAGPLHVRFTLASPNGFRVAILVLRDQLEHTEWRALVAAVERAVAAAPPAVHDSHADSF